MKNVRNESERNERNEGYQELFQKPYTQALDELRFSEEAKQNMTHQLFKAWEQSQTATGTPHKVRRSLSRMAVAGIAAACVFCIGAGAAVYQRASDAFAGVFGVAHTEIVDSIGKPIGASCSDNGVTITADAIIGDKYHYAITFSIANEDGSAFDTSHTVGEGVLPYHFASDSVDLNRLGGEHGGAYFYDADPTDNSIQYVITRAADGDVTGHVVKAHFENLQMWDENDELVLVTDGEWKLKFDLDFPDTSIPLPAGQSFHLNGMDATIDAITLSPLACRVDYTVHQQLQWDPNAKSGRQSEHDSQQQQRYFQSLTILVHKTDGTVIDLTNAGGSIAPQDGQTVCQKGEMFDEVIPLDEIVSLTVGDLEIPVK